jgi:hypothetical protein
MDSGNGIPHLKFLTGPLADRTFVANQLTQYDESNFIRIDAQNLKKTGNNNVILLNNISIVIPRASSAPWSAAPAPASPCSWTRSTSCDPRRNAHGHGADIGCTLLHGT